MSGQNLNKIEKVVINVGVGKMSSSMSSFEDKVLPEIIKDLSSITGQKPSNRMAKISIAGFKLRQGNITGLKTTIRGQRANQFVERLNKFVLPRLRDFQGIPLKNIDQAGNLSIGIKEHYVFPEINQETTKVNFGLQATIVLKEKNREKSIELYRQLGVPLQKS